MLNFLWLFMMEIKFLASLMEKILERKFLKEIIALLIKDEDWMVSVL